MMKSVIRQSICTLIVVAALISILTLPSVTDGRSAQKASLKWADAVSIQRKPRTNRPAPKARPKRIRAPLLTLQWNLFERGDGNVKVEVDPKKVFRTGDQIKLAITANQDGFLYVINQPEGKDGRLIFPDPRIDGGNPRVRKNEQYIVPSSCQDFEDPDDCWWEMQLPAGRELLLVVYSRDEIPAILPDRKIYKLGDVVKREVIDDIRKISGQKLEQASGTLEIPGRGATRFATRIQNTNRQDNEELIALIELDHIE